ncbi:MAG TPA: helix-turn-helix domain-containing protein [Gemmatimonadaceae bacterium]
MQDRWEPPALAIFPIAPPYIRFDPASDADHLCPCELSPGTIFGLQICGRPRSVEALGQPLHRIRSRFPAVPIVLRLSQPLDAEAVHLTQLATQLHVRGAIVEPEPVHQTLRRLLTNPVDLASDVVEWLSVRGPRLPPVVSHLVRQIFRLAPGRAEVRALLEEIGESARTARARCRKLGLPPPAGWLQVARAVHAALFLQRAPSTPLLEAAMRLGYSDHSALSHQLRRLFGMRTEVVRRNIGWEWLLDAWLVRRSTCVALPRASGAAGV